MIDPATMLMGWGAFSQSEGYSWVMAKRFIYT